jgi:hypothetical protein
LPSFDGNSLVVTFYFPLGGNFLLTMDVPCGQAKRKKM